jgi:Flp pilus assembly protein TadG
MRTLLHRYRRHVDRASQGQALAEFALIAVVLLLLFGTALDLGRVFYADITIENAARAGALQASRTPDSFKKTGCDYATNKIGCATINESRGSFVTIAPADIDSQCENLAGTTVACKDEPQPATRSRVTVSTRFDLLTPILAVFFGGQTIDMSATVASDQEALPDAATALSTPIPTPTGTVGPTATATATATATSTATAGPTATASSGPTAVPTQTPNLNCTPETVAPNLVVGLAGGSETVSQARTEWFTGAGFTGTFFPTSGQNRKIVTAQWANASKTIPLVAGACYPLTQQVWVDYQ